MKESIKYHKTFRRGIRRRQAFTLTEVLLGVVIVGIIASLVMPALLNSLQDKTLKAARDRNVQTILSAVNSLLINEDKDDYDKTMLYSSVVNPTSYSSTTGAFLKKYLKISRYCGDSNGDCFASKYYEYKNGDKVVYNPSYKGACASLKNGASYCMTPADPSTRQLYILMDLNGKKGPNIFGRDLILVDEIVLPIKTAVSRTNSEVDWHSKLVDIKEEETEPPTTTCSATSGDDATCCNNSSYKAAHKVSCCSSQDTAYFTANNCCDVIPSDSRCDNTTPPTTNNGYIKLLVSGSVGGTSAGSCTSNYCSNTTIQLNTQDTEYSYKYVLKASFYVPTGSLVGTAGFPVTTEQINNCNSKNGVLQVQKLSAVAANGPYCCSSGFNYPDKELVASAGEGSHNSMPVSVPLKCIEIQSFNKYKCFLYRQEGSDWKEVWAGEDYAGCITGTPRGGWSESHF